ncbi:MAG: T9SS type A sorting domain-containing protein [Bacteroidetes bacterium]|nr:T9SS type A sorting domain-containing protein [Bacteroidota bacterium]
MFRSIFTNEYTNLNLSPNDSIWINLGKIHSNIYSFLDTVDVNICVYTSHPNQVTDTIVPNDQFCKYLFLGYVGIKENEMQNISISPNPVKDVFHIENPELLNLSISVYNNLGQLVFVDSGDRGKFTVDLSNQSNGMHLVRLVSRDGEITRKIIKQ